MVRNTSVGESNRNGKRLLAVALKIAGLVCWRRLPASLLAGMWGGAVDAYYQLTVPNDMSAGEPNASGISLALGPLISSHLYREDRIVYSSGAEQMGTYEYQRWTEPPAEMISEVLVEGHLRASGRYREVYSRRSSSRADYVLRGDCTISRKCRAIRLTARVTAGLGTERCEDRDDRVVASLQHDEPVSGKDVPAMVAALDKNVQRAVGEVNSGAGSVFRELPATK